MRVRRVPTVALTGGTYLETRVLLVGPRGLSRSARDRAAARDREAADPAGALRGRPGAQKALAAAIAGPGDRAEPTRGLVPAQPLSGSAGRRPALRPDRHSLFGVSVL